ncbi:MAG: RnfABCDGE type electron transport complex subunit G [Clostridia bacterium]|nr:RnfABCDGE type electron transport complex subunit G [Clostridia bacterium]
MKSMIKNTLVIVIITIISGALLGGVYTLTKEPIAVQKEKTKQEACKTVFQKADSFRSIEDVKEETQSILDQAGFDQESIDEIYEACDQSGQKIGYVLSVTSKEGYGGDINFMMGIDMEGVLNGIEIISINETAGLGMKAKEPDFINQFSDRKVQQFTLTKGGASQDYEIDALSGATVTSNAMVNGVNAGLTYFNAICAKGGAETDE